MKERDYVKNTRGHVWATDEDGVLDIFAYEGGDYHNGPKCVKCGYGFCHHCKEGPAKDCSSQETEDRT